MAVSLTIGCCTATAGAGVGTTATTSGAGGVRIGFCCCAFGTGGKPFETGAVDAAVLVVPDCTGAAPGLLVLKYSTHTGSTEVGSAK